jgi:hypothetical protein
MVTLNPSVFDTARVAGQPYSVNGEFPSGQKFPRPLVAASSINDGLEPVRDTNKLGHSEIISGNVASSGGMFINRELRSTAQVAHTNSIKAGPASNKPTVGMKNRIKALGVDPGPKFTG